MIVRVWRPILGVLKDEVFWKQSTRCPARYFATRADMYNRSSISRKSKKRTLPEVPPGMLKSDVEEIDRLSWTVRKAANKVWKWSIHPVDKHLKPVFVQADLEKWARLYHKLDEPTLQLCWSLVESPQMPLDSQTQSALTFLKANDEYVVATLEGHIAQLKGVYEKSQQRLEAVRQVLESDRKPKAARDSEQLGTEVMKNEEAGGAQLPQTTHQGLGERKKSKRPVQAFRNRRQDMDIKMMLSVLYSINAPSREQGNKITRWARTMLPQTQSTGVSLDTQYLMLQSLQSARFTLRSMAKPVNEAIRDVERDMLSLEERMKEAIKKGALSGESLVEIEGLLPSDEMADLKAMAPPDPDVEEMIKLIDPDTQPGQPEETSSQ